jgi:hypothetical protein
MNDTPPHPGDHVAGDKMSGDITNEAKETRTLPSGTAPR